MADIQEARSLLEALGMPAPQRNEIAAYTLLAFSGLAPDAPWSSAQPVRLNPHGVLQFLRGTHAKNYAENTREVVRRQVIYYWIQGGILVLNPDDPSIPTNSANTHYALTEEALEAIQAFGTPHFEAARARFLDAVEGGLVDRYASPRRLSSVPVTLPDGQELLLSPGAHNELQAEIVGTFLPMFAPGSRLLYLGDAESFDTLGVSVELSGKFADIVALDSGRNWLFLCEAVASHGPVSPKRYLELEELFGAVEPRRVYVSAFPSFVEYKRFATEIAWETEVWIAEIPDHLLHYDGAHFISPTGPQA